MSTYYTYTLNGQNNEAFLTKVAGLLDIQPETLLVWQTDGRPMSGGLFFFKHLCILCPFQKRERGRICIYKKKEKCCLWTLGIRGLCGGYD